MQCACLWPVGLNVLNSYDFRNKTRSALYRSDQAREKAYEKLAKEEEIMFSNIEILDKKVEEIAHEGSYELKAYYTCKENIELQQEFIVN